MKILQIGMGNIAGGLESFVMNYYRVLVHMDVQFDFVCMYDKIAYEDEKLSRLCEAIKKNPERDEIRGGTCKYAVSSEYCSASYSR